MRFIDLFAGIGAFRLALESIGFECAYSCELNKNACQIYQENFGDNPFGDITSLDVESIPNHDVLCAGFPCQAFSISGKQKGFEDSRGTLFFDVLRILESKKPTYFILENVANLLKHNNGETFSTIEKSLVGLGYSVSFKILNAKDFGVPQNRERLFIVGNLNGEVFDFYKLKTTPIKSMVDFLDDGVDFEYLNESEYTIIQTPRVQEKSGLKFVGYLNKNFRKVGIRKNTEHLSRTHRQPNRIYSVCGNHPTLTSQEKSGRYWIQTNFGVRKLTLNECFRFMGFPDDFKKVGTNSNIYERIGNSICVNVVKSIVEALFNK